MFKHLLVPLDGSSLAEAALPYAAYIAGQLGATVTLIHVIERNPPQTVHGSSHLTTAEAASHYLDDVAARAFPPGVMVARHVHTSEVSEVARSIVEHAGEFRPDLIVMCTHGSGGLRNLLFGSIAQQVISLGRTSMLLIPPGEGGAAASQVAFACRSVLVPLDGDAEHEQGIAAAIDFARICSSAVHLLVVVRTPGTLTGERAAASRMLPGVTAELLRLTEQSAQEYLRRHMTRLQPTGLNITAEVARGDPAKTILGVAQRINADLIVLGTHGKSGMDAFWQGSVAPKVSSQSVVPLLLVRLSDTAG
jgi:nucleotide-binding universal stress UspA family protein